ncbi:mannan endo-1,4-beta-mannosidase-like [Haliotis rubra]|uniref:mannan endo-1,4-beta-mannosidase-like n=1 Tax=Haliotis rubra TaxID=36100 RepID=UPI001EE60245|nr:mannan endo-1,4-beta-mannosidase-like [Haliotis rubra]
MVLIWQPPTERLLQFLLCWFLGSVAPSPVDQHATEETKLLCANMKTFANDANKIIFGHQEDTWLGASGGRAPYQYSDLKHNGSINGWIFILQQAQAGDPDALSDVLEMTGQRPALTGFDFFQLDDDHMFTMSYLAKLAHAKGQIITVTQLLDNPITNGSAWVEKDHGQFPHIVRRLLPGGDFNHVYRQNLDKIADWALNLKDSKGRLIPIIYRALHEQKGEWFWWGLNNKAHNTPQDVQNLYRYLVSYLRDTKGVHNILYAICPDKFKDEADYLKVYPGDNYVDIIGTDYYFDNGSHPSTEDFKRTLEQVVDIAERRGKTATLTETGIRYNGLDKVHNFWNDHILDVIKSSPRASRIAYVYAWSNHCFGQGRCEVYIPYKGHPSEKYYVNNFFKDSMTYFLNRIGNIFS